MERRINDDTAIILIHQALSGTEWSADTTQEIAEIVELTGRKIAAPDA